MSQSSLVHEGDELALIMGWKDFIVETRRPFFINPFNDPYRAEHSYTLTGTCFPFDPNKATIFHAMLVSFPHLYVFAKDAL
jgi:hypothetical protein